MIEFLLEFTMGVLFVGLAVLVAVLVGILLLVPLGMVVALFT